MVRKTQLRCPHLGRRPSLLGGLAGGAESGGDVGPGVPEPAQDVDCRLGGGVQLAAPGRARSVPGQGLLGGTVGRQVVLDGGREAGGGWRGAGSSSAPSPVEDEGELDGGQHRAGTSTGARSGGGLHPEGGPDDGQAASGVA
jgi:hypothetical protein